VAGDVIISPDGLTTGDLMSEDSSLSIHIIQQLGITSTAGQPYTVSVFARAASHTSFQIAFSVTAFGSTHANFILTGDGSIGTVGGLTARIEKYPNGWYRCSATLASAGGGSGGSVVIVANNNNSSSSRIPSYQGTGAQVVYLWGAQVEAGSFATSYIPTVASSVVRSADVCSITGGDFNNFYNQSEGSFACNYSITAGFTGNRYAASIEDTVGGAQNGFAFRNTNSATSFIASAGYASAIGAVTTGVSKHILAYSGLSEFVYVKDSVVGTTTGSGTRDPSLLIRMSIGSLEGANAFTLCGHISSIRYYRNPLSNAEHQTLTATVSETIVYNGVAIWYNGEGLIETS
jgi:hypothetical protein